MILMKMNVFNISRVIHLFFVFSLIVKQYVCFMSAAAELCCCLCWQRDLFLYQTVALPRQHSTNRVHLLGPVIM